MIQRLVSVCDFAPRRALLFPAKRSCCRALLDSQRSRTVLTTSSGRNSFLSRLGPYQANAVAFDGRLMHPESPSPDRSRRAARSTAANCTAPDQRAFSCSNATILVAVEMIADEVAQVSVCSLRANGPCQLCLDSMAALSIEKYPCPALLMHRAEYIYQCQGSILAAVRPHGHMAPSIAPPVSDFSRYVKPHITLIYTHSEASDKCKQTHPSLNTLPTATQCGRSPTMTAQQRCDRCDIQ